MRLFVITLPFCLGDFLPVGVPVCRRTRREQDLTQHSGRRPRGCTHSSRHVLGFTCRFPEGLLSMQLASLFDFVVIATVFHTLPVGHVDVLFASLDAGWSSFAILPFSPSLFCVHTAEGSRRVFRTWCDARRGRAKLTSWSFRTCQWYDVSARQC